jgi:hypothetical protein
LSNASDKVICGFMNLSPDEQDEALNVIITFYEEINQREKNRLKGKLEKRAIDLGPTGGRRCPCCGK